MDNINKVGNNRIKIEAVSYYPPEQPKGSKFGRFLRSFGAVATPVGFASAFFFPPAALIGAGAYGLNIYGNHLDQTRNQPIIPPTPYYPAITTSAGGPNVAAPIGSPSTGVTDPINVISNRQAATNSMIQRVEPTE